MKTCAIVQARLSSTRLPGKVMKELPHGSGITVLERVIERLSLSKLIDRIILATASGDDEEIIKLAEKKMPDVLIFRGEKDDVLKRYYDAARTGSYSLIVRITSDCPCVDAAVLDRLIHLIESSHADYASNIIERTYPSGLDAEVFTFQALERAFRDATSEYEHEHVTPYIYRHPEIFKLSSLTAPPEFQRPDIRVTLDTPEDYALLNLIFEEMDRRNLLPGFSTGELVALFDEKPWMTFINRRIRQKQFIADRDSEIKEAITVLNLQGLSTAAAILEQQLTGNRK